MNIKILNILLSVVTITTIQASVPTGILKLTTGIFANGGQGFDIKVQTGAGGSGQAGKIVICGTTVVGGQNRWTVARFTSVGTLDPTFNTASTPGYWQSTVNGSSAYTLVIDPSNDKIYVGGMRFSAATSQSAGIMRFSAAGVVELNQFPGANFPTTAGGRIISMAMNGTTICAVGISGASANMTFLFLDQDLAKVGAGTISDATAGAYAGSRGGIGFSSTQNLYYGSLSMSTGPVNRQGRTQTSGTTTFLAGAGRAGFMVIHPSDGLPRLTVSNGTNQVILAQSSTQTTAATYTVVANNRTDYPYGYGGGIALTNSSSTASMVTCACNSSQQPYIARLLSNGTKDNSFGSSGVTQETSSTITPGYYSNVAIQPDGKAVVIGFTTNGGLFMLLARYTTAGVLDTTFNGRQPGVLQDTTIPFSGGLVGLLLTTTINQAGQLVVGGYYGSNAIGIRYSATGARDSGFGGTGVGVLLLTSLATTSSLNKIINAASNTYLATGQANNQFTTLKLTSAGVLDTANFNSPNGFVTESSVGVSQGYDMLLNGTALAVAGVTNTNKPSVINYNATTGVRSNTIGQNGLQQFSNFGTGIMYGIQTTTGTKQYGAGQASNTAFVRLLNDTAGILQDTASPFGSPFAGLLLTTTIDQSGKLVVGGSYANTGQLIRYNVTGASPRDATFGDTGVADDFIDSNAVNKVINAASNGYLVAGVANSNTEFITGLYGNDGLLNTAYGSPNGTVQETTVGVSAAYDMLLNGTALAVSGFTNTNIPSVINYNASTGVRNSALGDNGLQQFSNFGTGIMYGIQTTTGTKRYGAGQASSTAFVRLLGDNAGLFQDAASPFNTGANGVILSTVIDPSGKLVVGGYYGSNAMAARYNVASSPVRDNSFDTDGALLLTSLATASSLNKIVTAGTGYLAAGQSNNQLTSVKITNAGALDASYGDGGVVQETMLGTSTGVSVVINSDGTLVVGGQSTVSGVLLPTLISYTAAGIKIPTFGTGGVQTYNNFGVGIWNDLVVPATGVLAAAGQTGNIATIMAIGQSNDLVEQLNDGF